MILNIYVILIITSKTRFMKDAFQRIVSFTLYIKNEHDLLLSNLKNDSTLITNTAYVSQRKNFVECDINYNIKNYKICKNKLQSFLLFIIFIVDFAICNFFANFYIFKK